MLDSLPDDSVPDSAKPTSSEAATRFLSGDDTALPMLCIDETERTDADGRKIIRFTPVFTPDVCASGSLSFAFHEEFATRPDLFDAARVAAFLNARTVLARYAHQITSA